jgi:hypothetical protein
MNMNDRDAHQNSNTSKKTPLVDQLRRDSQDPSEVWTDRFRKLAQAIEEVSDIELSCEDCHTLLDILIHQELENQNAAETYPVVWRHLESCADCRTDFETIVSTLREERRTPYPLAPEAEAQERLQSLPFLRHEPVEKWYIRVRSRLAGMRPGFDIQLGFGFLRNKLWPQRLEPGATLRSSPVAIPGADTRLLLIDLVSFQGQQINVQLEAEHDPDSEQISLHAILAGQRALPHNLWMQLNWAGQVYDAPVTLAEDDEEGHSTIDDIPLADLHDAADEHTRFDISFEVRTA